MARGAAEREQATIAAENALINVNVVRPQPAQGGKIVLPGTLEAWNRAEISARVSGYVRAWRADIGDTVRAGQTLALLDAPELDQQLAQARADYQTASADRELARISAERWESLLAKDAVSRQERDEKHGQFVSIDARARAAEANVGRLRAMQGFTQLSAPFDGVVTSRSAQLGALVSAGSAGGEPLFTIADVSRLRLHVRVPQTAAHGLAEGIRAQFSLPQQPGEHFEAVLVRTAEAVERRSGTMLVEFLMENRDRRLRPGAYVDVRIPIAGAAGAYQLPASTLILGSKGTRVAVVDGNGRVSLRPVKVGRDQGATIEILAGVTARDRIVLTPPDSLVQGEQVRVVRSNMPKADNAKS
ncbi:RND family efflux transporter MFP subunit [Sphingobium wenxiniae]|nr:efflux RND transporter periplasmic adaptor subunit [Sphingobium wenxiniae]MBB6192769.1 RND family efflux transporter MFP subunit [Sphingobium wenxiniae]